MASEKQKAEGWVVVSELRTSGCSGRVAEAPEASCEESLTDSKPVFGPVTHFSANKVMSPAKAEDMSAQSLSYAIDHLSHISQEGTDLGLWKSCDKNFLSKQIYRRDMLPELQYDMTSPSYLLGPFPGRLVPRDYMPRSQELYPSVGDLPDFQRLFPSTFENLTYKEKIEHLETCQRYMNSAYFTGSMLEDDDYDGNRYDVYQSVDSRTSLSVRNNSSDQLDFSVASRLDVLTEMVGNDLEDDDGQHDLSQSWSSRQEDVERYDLQ